MTDSWDTLVASYEILAKEELPVEERTIPELDKPNALLALGDVAEELFGLLQRWFDVPPTVSFDLSAVDSPDSVRELGDPMQVTAFAMRKLQALHRVSIPGVRTTSHTVINLLDGLHQALVEAGRKRHFVPRSLDVSCNLDRLIAGELSDPPGSVTDVDPEQERFEFLHGQLHEITARIHQACDGRFVIFV